MKDKGDGGRLAGRGDSSATKQLRVRPRRWRRGALRPGFLIFSEADLQCF